MPVDRSWTRHGPSHPVALAGLLLLVVNDHVLKRTAPSWWTGKLSDVAFLVVAPVLLAAVAARLGLPDRRSRPTALAVVGVGFVVLQLWPPLGRGIASMLGGSHVADLGDLVALPALWLARSCWRPHRTRGWAQPLAAGACVATSWGAEHCPFVRSPWKDAVGVDPAAPLQLGFALELVPPGSPAIERNVVVVEAATGREVELVFAAEGSALNICPKGGLLPNTTYTWTVGPFESDSSNHVGAPAHPRDGRWTFTTGPRSGLDPVTTEIGCSRQPFVNTCPLKDSGESNRDTARSEQTR